MVRQTYIVLVNYIVSVVEVVLVVALLSFLLLVLEHVILFKVTL